MQNRIVLISTDGSAFYEEDILSFRFIKDAYTPYTSLSVKIYAHRRNYSNICQAFFYVNNIMIHHGLIDGADIENSNGSQIVNITSRSFTSLLCQNQIEPGLIFRISINKLMDSYYQLPYVTHEDNSDESNYIYVKNHSTMWDGVVNLSYKLTGMYPYISGTNCVRITADSDPPSFSYDDDQILATGMAYDFKRMISHFNMSDINGDYGNITLEDSFVTDKKIIRHNVFELDRQFLYDPQQALEYRSKFSKRGNMRVFCRYCGYNGEDLCDFISFGNISQKRIGRIEITGSSSGITTELSVYNDGFYVDGSVQ